MEKRTKKWFINGTVVGFLIGTIYVATNKKSRTCVVDYVKNTTNQTKHWVNIINENRDTVVDQIKNSGEKISTVVESASEDIEKLMETGKNMKGHLDELLIAVQDTTDEFKELKDKLRYEGTDIQEVLPEPGEEQNRLE